MVTMGQGRDRTIRWACQECGRPGMDKSQSKARLGMALESGSRSRLSWDELGVVVEGGWSLGTPHSLDWERDLMVAWALCGWATVAGGEACSPKCGSVQTGPTHPGAPGHGSYPGTCAPAKGEWWGGLGQTHPHPTQPGGRGRGESHLRVSACLFPSSYLLPYSELVAHSPWVTLALHLQACLPVFCLS